MLVWSTTKLRPESPGGKVMKTGLSVVPTCVSSAAGEDHRAGLVGCETTRVPTENLPRQQGTQLRVKRDRAGPHGAGHVTPCQIWQTLTELSGSDRRRFSNEA